MTTTEIKTTIETLKEWESLLNEASEMVESLKDSLKAEMIARDLEELAIDDTNYILRYTNVISNRFDSTSFKKKYKEMYLQFTKQITSRRFTISV